MPTAGAAAAAAPTTTTPPTAAAEAGDGIAVSAAGANEEERRLLREFKQLCHAGGAGPTPAGTGLPSPSPAATPTKAAGAAVLSGASPSPGPHARLPPSPAGLDLDLAPLGTPPPGTPPLAASPASPTVEAMHLPSRGAAAARLHGALLAAGLARKPLAHLQLLFRLLSVPPDVQAPSTEAAEAEESEVDLGLGSGEVGAAYACLVLDAAGQLPLILGARTLRALQDSLAATADRGGPACVEAFRRKVEAALERHRSSQLRFQKSYDVKVASSGPDRRRGSSVGVAMLAGGETRPRSATAEEARRSSNREHVRDAFCAMLRDHGRLVHAFLSTSQSTALNGAYPRLAARGGFQGDIAVLGEMAYLVKKLLAALWPDNYRWFAELLLTRVLQAAVLGEADDEVIGLARSNSAKMQGLQQRLSGPARLERSAGGRGPGTVHGAVDHGFKTAPRRPAGAGGPPAAAAKSPAAAAAMPLANSIAASVAAFPQPLRFHAFFVAVADSSRLNSCLLSVLLARLDGLHGVKQLRPGAAGSSSVYGEKIMELRAIGAFLGYLTFAHPNGGPEAEAAAPAAGLVSSQLFPLAAVPSILKQAASFGALIMTVPWVLEYLRFLKWHPQAVVSDGARDSLATLKSLYRVPYVSPKGSDFTIGGLCLRTVLDAFFDAWGEEVRDAWGNLDMMVGTTQKDVLDLREGLADVQCLQACCPPLEELTVYLTQAPTGRIMAVRKITTTKVTGAGPARAAGPPLGAPKLVADEARLNGAYVELQRAFLRQYPALKGQVDLVVDTVTANALGLSLKRAAQDAAQAGVTEATLQAATEAAWETALATSRGFIRERAPAALRALADPALPPGVVGTACALAVESAAAACARTLADRVPAEVRQRVGEAAKAQAKARARGPPSPARSPSGAGREAPDFDAILNQYAQALGGGMGEDGADAAAGGAADWTFHAYGAYKQLMQRLAKAGEVACDPPALLREHWAGRWAVQSDPFALTFISVVAVAAGLQARLEAAGAAPADLPTVLEFLAAGDGAPTDEHGTLGGHVALAFKATKPWLAALRRKWAPKKAYLLAALAYLRERPSRCSAMLLAALVTPVLQPPAGGGSVQTELLAVHRELGERTGEPGPTVARDLVGRLAAWVG